MRPQARRARAAFTALALMAVAALAGSTPVARAAGLVADLSHRLIAITTAFSGTDVLLFGALETPGADVVVVVRGPPVDQVVRRKSRIGLIWLNTEEVRFRSVPHYFAVAASRPLRELAPAGELLRHQLGTDWLRLEPGGRPALAPGELDEFREALARNKQRAGLWTPGVGKVSFLGDKLFRTTLFFPANVPPGSYQVQVFELRDGQVTSAQSSALVISKVGLEADISNFAQRDAALYGLAAVLIAVAAGWAASAIFQKR